jgi:spore maturation protein CgeB
MNISFWTHSLRSDWNHGNAHFLRGLAVELQTRGHMVQLLEPRTSWSAQNLVADAGEAALDAYKSAYPTLEPWLYDPENPDVPALLEGADLVLMHEWNPPPLVAQVGDWKKGGAKGKLLFHDTHHRAASAPHEMAGFDLSGYDGALCFGEVISQIYRERGWAKRAWTWHEAADPRIFKPQTGVQKEFDLVWIGNWGDGERSLELREFLIQPVKELGLKAKIWGVRYPADALQALEEANIEYGGYIPNFRAPDAFACANLTVHVPRRPYVEHLPGIPTIRPFEALACELPLISAPWHDCEALFREGDFRFVSNGREMTRALEALLSDEAARMEMAARGRETVLARHTVGNRIDELEGIVGEL